MAACSARLRLADRRRTAAVAQSVNRTTAEQESSVTPSATAPLGTGSSVLTRDANGRLIVRATRITQPIAVDGQLDEVAYRNVPAITEFVQQVPSKANR